MRSLPHNWITALIITSILLGSVLRLYQLGQIPGGLGWDEAAIGYNGWSIWTTRRDEWLTKLPISFRSFGDYKAPLAIYMNGPFTLLFGMNSLAVRLPFALFACLTLVIWWRLLDLIRRNAEMSQLFVLIGVALFAFSPWHFVFSRIAFESVICLFFVVFGVWTALLAIYGARRPTLLFTLSGLSFVASLYTYHSAKIVVPLLIVLLAVLWWKPILRLWKQLIVGLVLSFVVVLPLAYDSIIGQGATRAGDLVFLQLKSPDAIVRSMAGSMLAHANPGFFLLGKGDELRHVIGTFGTLLPGTALLALICVLYFFRSLKAASVQGTGERSKLILFAGIWLLIGMLPGYFSTVFPHANRTLLALPGILLLATFGFDICLHSSWWKQRGKTMLIPTIIIIDVLWFSAFISIYFTHYSAASEVVFQAGYKQAVTQSSEALRGEGAVEQVVFSSAIGQPYIYTLFYNKISPLSYHHGALSEYLFVNEVTIGDVSRSNALLVFTPKDPLSQNVHQLPVSVILENSGEPRFYLVRTREIAK